MRKDIGTVICMLWAKVHAYSTFTQKRERSCCGSFKRKVKKLVKAVLVKGQEGSFNSLVSDESLLVIFCSPLAYSNSDKLCNFCMV